MKRSFLPLIALALLAGCTSETFQTEKPSDNEFVSSVTITAKDFILDAATRTSLEATGEGLDFTWAADDVAGIYPDVGDQVSFPMTGGAGTKEATFDGGGWALKGGHTYAAYYPFSKANFDNPYIAIPISYLGQKQTANNSTAGLGAYDYMVAAASTPESAVVTFNFEHIGSVLYIQLTAPEAATFTTLTLSADDPIFTTEATVNVATGELTATTTASEVTLDLTNIAVGANGTLDAWLLIAPVDASSKTLTATLKTAIYDSYTATLTGKAFEGGKAYKLEGTLEKTMYVDLGLPSGLLWATMNVGASSPVDYGDYFAWGETTAKSNYDWSTYKWCNGSYDSLTKYNTSSTYGTVDNKTVLDLADDAARANWGGSWRMPTHAEWNELANTSNCTWTWTTLNDVNGYQVTSKSNGNSIFLPAAGYRLDASPYYAGSYGYYWSSSLYESIPSFAWYLNFGSGDVNSGYCNDRYYGRSVRPVCRP